MKKLIIIYFLMIFCFLSNNAYTQVYFEPIKLDFHDIKRINADFFIYGTKGFILKFDSTFKSIKKYKIFNSGKILNIFLLNNKYYIFGENNQVACTDDFEKGLSVKNLDLNQILSVCIVYNKFLIRTEDKLLLIDSNLKLLNQYSLVSSDLSQFSPKTKFKYDYSMCFFKDKILVETDSLKILVFNEDLKILDSIKIDLNKKSSKNKYISGYRLMSDSNSLYITSYVKDSTSNNISTIIFRTTNLIDFHIYDSLSKYVLTKSINDSIYCIDISDKKFIDTNRVSFINQEYMYNYVYFNLLFNEFWIDNNFIYIVGNGGIIEKVKVEDNSIDIISEQYWIDESKPPIIINDSCFIFFSGFNKQVNSAIYPYFYKTSDLVSFKTTLYRNIPNFNDSLLLSRFFVYDFKNGVFYLIGKYDYRQNPAYAIFSSKDTLKSINFTLANNWKISNLSLDLNADVLSRTSNSCFNNPKMLKFQNNYYFVNNSTRHPLTKKDYTSFTILNNDYYPIDKYNDSTYVMDFVYLKSFNNFLVHCANTIDSGRSEIKYTDNHGATWNYVYKYEKKDTLLSKYHIFLNNKDYLLLFHYDGSYAPTKMYFDIVDLQSYSWKRIRQWDLTKKKTDFTKIGIYSDGSKLNFAIGDTLFYIEDLFNTQSWAFRILPDSGKMYDPMIKFGDKFISNFDNRYGKFGLCVISFQDTALLGIKEYSTEKRNYLYSMPPYPIPATNRVRVEIFWDTGLDINNAEIKIYNIYGEEISSKNSVQIIPERNWYGKLIWHCEGNEPGVYIITIAYGSEKKAIKVIKN